MLSACLIVKNEENNLINCLGSIKNSVDEIILVDTGSVDSTINIAKKFACKIYDFKWENDFSKARNYSISKAKGDYILIIDADEVLIDKNNNLKNLCNQENKNAYLIDVISKSNDSSGVLRNFISSQIRLFPNHLNLKFEGAIHEQIIQDIIIKGINILKSDISILHNGYNLPDNILYMKNLRNLEILNKETSLNNSKYFLIHKAKTLIALKKFEEAETYLSNLDFSDSEDYYEIQSLNLLSEISIKQNNLDKAINFLQKSIHLNSKQIYPLYKLADIYFANGEYEISLRNLLELEKVINTDFQFVSSFQVDKLEIILKITKLYILLKKDFEAYNYLQNFFDEYQIDSNFLILYCIVLYKNRKFEESENIYSKLINILGSKSKADFEILSLRRQFHLLEKNFVLSLCMIVRDEELYLEDCLKSVENIVDEIIIVDTGSKDNTKSIAEKFNSKLYNFKWVNDFSKARNESIKYASGKWILYLDADERLELQNKHSFIELLKNSPDDIGAINCIVESKTQKFNGSVELQKGVYPRIFRNYGYPKIRFEGIIHEQISNSLKELNKSVMISDIKILHLGYAKDLETLKSKAERNYRLLLEAIQKNPNDAYSFFQLGQTLIHLNNFEDAEFYIMKSLEIGKLSQALMSSAYNLLAQLKGRKRLYKEALEYAEKSIEIEYFQELAHSIKSEILIHTNRKEESKKVLKDLLNIKKNKPINQNTGFDISIPEHQIINVIENLTGEK